MSELEIKYVVMPITKEQKKDLNKKGYRAVDAQFAPEGSDILDFGKKETKLSIQELRDALTEAGVEFPEDAKKAELSELYKGIQKAED